MSGEAKRVLDEALALDDDERLAIATRLLDTIGQPADEVGKAWRREVRQRLEDLENGTSSLARWEDVQSRIFAKLP